MNISNPQPVLITGASSGIGRALALEYQRRKFPVVATARRLTSLKDLENSDTLLLELDVNREESVEKAVKEAGNWRGGIETVINNAGWGLMGPLAELEIAAFQQLLETNLVGVLRVSQAVLKPMIARRQGMIVNIGSVSGVVTTPFAGAYCASKAALHALSEGMRMELAPFGIRVVEVQPGAVLSSFGSTASAATNLPPADSPYFPIRDRIADRAAASQRAGMPASEFAGRLLDRLLAARVPSVIRLAPLSRKLPLLGQLPVRVRDRIFAKRFGLDRLD